ncbi:MAG: choice-of-anchor I family protein [Phycisphaerales bacterium]|nr:choice-of-anchor I family protein [Phycisphaerales bacterium]
MHPERKGPGHSGPFKNAFADRALLVYATGGDEAENAWAFEKARFDAETFKYRGNGAFEVVSDAVFLGAKQGSTLADGSRNVILYGNSATNRAWGAVLEGGDVSLDRAGVRLGREQEVGDLGLLAVRPRKGGDGALVGIVGGTTVAGCRTTDRMPYFVSGVAYPDYTVLAADVYSEGIDGVVSAGYFRGDWSLGGESAAGVEAAGRTTPAAPGALELVDHIRGTSGGAEIVAFDPVHHKLFATHERGLDVYEVSDEGRLTAAGTIDCTAFVPGLSSASSVAIDPAGRGFGAVTLIPGEKDTIPGVLALFETETAKVIATFAVGFNPDMVCFSPDGGRVLVADEGEPGEVDPAGAISVLDLSGVRRPRDAARLGADRLTTIDLSPEHLGEGVGFAGLRIAPERKLTPWLDLEPEYIAPDLEGAWVTLQENNGIARFDFASGLWSRIVPLGKLTQVIDASDRDGGVHIDKAVACLPMPDSIAAYSVGGRQFLVMANEGDSREGDEVRFAEAKLDPVLLATMLARGGDPRAESAMGRLHISVRDGDTDGDGDIDVPTTLGARSFSILDAETGERVYDSGSGLEVLTAAIAPGRFNSNGDAGTFDQRSDDRGPEPEGVAVARLGDRQFAFIGLERTGGVVMFDVTTPASAKFVDYAPPGDSADAGVGPEGLAVLKMGDATFLAVACEVSGSIEIYRVNPDRR